MLQPQYLPFPPSVRQACFNRHGGESKPPFASLNCGLTVGDQIALVNKNISRAQSHLGLKKIIMIHQVHGQAIHQATSQDIEPVKADAIITNEPGLGLLIQHADCQAIMLYDPKNKAVANIHSGWQGSVANIIKGTIKKMMATFNSYPQDLIAAISPSLGPCCAEFINHCTELPSSFQQFMTTENYFDFWQISRHQLEQAQLRPENIHIAQVCTKCNSNWFSYRRQKITGRNCSIIGLTYASN